MASKPIKSSLKYISYDIFPKNQYVSLQLILFLKFLAKIEVVIKLEKSSLLLKYVL